MRLARFLILFFMIMGSYFYTWYKADVAKHDLELLESRMQLEATLLTQELEGKLIQELFKRRVK
jgi:hypothetical protein